MSGNIQRGGDLPNSGNKADLHNLVDDAIIRSDQVTNAMVNSSAAILESKIAFSTSGHAHDGIDAASVLIKHYRKGCLVKTGTTATTDVKVTPGVVEIAGKLLISVADINIDISTAGNYADGNSEPADGAVYVYGFNDSDSLGIKLATEPPDLSYTSGTAEFPLRYQIYDTVNYRLLGIVHNRTDIQLDMFNQFDGSNFSTGSFTADGNDETVFLGWTPDVVKFYLCADSAPATSEDISIIGLAQRYGFITANPQPIALYYSEQAAAIPIHTTSANGTANSIYNMNAQTTSQSGSFTIDAPTNGVVLMWQAWSEGMHG